jgi:hypothetical protein
MRVIGHAKKRVIEGSNVTMVEVVVENGYKKEDGPSFVGGNEHQWAVDVDRTLGNMVLGSKLMHEQLQSSPMAVEECRRFSVGRLNDDFDVGSYKWDKLEKEEEERTGDEVSSDSENSDHDEGASAS